LKRAEKIGAAVERVMQRHHGHRYYDWKLEDGRLRYFEHPLNFREKRSTKASISSKRTKPR